MPEPGKSRTSDLLFAAIPVAVIVLFVAGVFLSMREKTTGHDSVQVVFDGHSVVEKPATSVSVEKPPLSPPESSAVKDRASVMGKPSAEPKKAELEPPPSTPGRGNGVGESVRPKGVKFTRNEMGKKVKVVTPKDPDGAWVGVGDKVDEFVVTSIARQSVVLSLYRSDQVYSISMPRE